VSCLGLGKISKTTYAFDDNPAQAMSHENNRASLSLCFVQLVNYILIRFPYLCQRSFAAQVGNQVPCVVVDGLTLNRGGAMGFGLISPAEDTCLWNV
jgi:hypothetical protein